MNLVQCVGGRTWLALLATVLCLLVMAGYVIIGIEHHHCSKELKQGPARTALEQLRNIFLFCGVCGYFFFPIKFFASSGVLPYVWTTWVACMFFLVYYTWRYVFGRRRMRMLYRDVALASVAAQTLRSAEDGASRGDMGYVIDVLRHQREIETQVRARLGLPLQR